MNRYEKLEIEVRNVKVIDILTESPNDFGGDTPGIGIPDNMLSPG